MHSKDKKELFKHFEEIKDPRREHKKLHKLVNILFIAICAVIANAESFVDIEAFGKAKEKWFKKILKLPNGIPSHDTFGRVFSVLDPSELQKNFMSWVQSVQQIMKGQVVAIDGKTLRRSFDSDSDTPAIHMISAWASANRPIHVRKP